MNTFSTVIACQNENLLAYHRLIVVNFSFLSTKFLTDFRKKKEFEEERAFRALFLELVVSKFEKTNEKSRWRKNIENCVDLQVLVN